MKKNLESNLPDKKIQEKMCALCGGACCREIEVPIGFKTPDILNWISIHEKVEIQGKRLHIAVPCQYLHQGKCLVYHDSKKRPRLCYEFEVGNRNCLRYIRKYCPENKEELLTLAKVLERNNQA
jgi:hypothetical protein